MRVRRSIALGICGSFALAAGAAHAAPVTFDTALPVSQDRWVGRELIVFGKAARQGTEVHETRSVAAFGYGVTPDLAIFGIVPWIDRNLDLSGGGERGSTGLGDIQLFARYTVWRHDLAGSTLRIAPIVGLELPTGQHRKSDAHGHLPPGLQPGSGSWDPFGGVVISWATLGWTVDGQATFQANTKADGISLGDVLRMDLAVHRRLLPARLTGGEQGFLYGGVELNFRHQGRTRINTITDPDSGGSAFSVTPILQYARKRWIAEGGIQIPVTRSPNRANFKEKFALIAGLHLNF